MKKMLVILFLTLFKINHAQTQRIPESVLNYSTNNPGKGLAYIPAKGLFIGYSDVTISGERSKKAEFQNYEIVGSVPPLTTAVPCATMGFGTIMIGYCLQGTLNNVSGNSGFYAVECLPSSAMCLMYGIVEVPIFLW
jgi:hypothetical protein